MLYSKNLSVAIATIKKIKDCKIIKFNSQNALYSFIEDIKNPGLQSYRDRYRSGHGPYYTPANYDGIVKYLIDNGVLENSRKGNRYIFTVNKSQPLFKWKE